MPLDDGDVRYSKKFGIAGDISTAHGKILMHASMTISKNGFAKEIPLFMRARRQDRLPDAR